MCSQLKITFEKCFPAFFWPQEEYNINKVNFTSNNGLENDINFLVYCEELILVYQFALKRKNAQQHKG